MTLKVVEKRKKKTYNEFNYNNKVCNNAVDVV